MLMVLWHWLFPERGPSPTALESIARTKAVTEMLRADADRFREKEAEIRRLDRL